MINSFIDLYDITLTIVFVCCICCISASMLLFQIEIVEYLLSLLPPLFISWKREWFYFYFQSSSEPDLVVIFEAVVFGAWVLMLLLFVCELGQVCFNQLNPMIFIEIHFFHPHDLWSGIEQRFSDSTSEMDEVIIQYDWHSFPSKALRILPMVMQNTQKPIVIKCFGNVLCARMQLQKVSIIAQKT